MGKQTFRPEKILRQAFFCRDQGFSVGFDEFCGIIDKHTLFVKKNINMFIKKNELFYRKIESFYRKKELFFY